MSLPPISQPVAAHQYSSPTRKASAPGSASGVNPLAISGSLPDTVHFGMTGQDSRQHNALTLAVKNGQLEKLAGHTPQEINNQDSKGWTPLTLAAATGQSRAIEMLCQNLGADINLPETHGHTPLMVAVFKEKPEAVRSLVQLGADLQVKDRMDHTALQIARKKLAEYPQNRKLQDIVQLISRADSRNIHPMDRDATLKHQADADSPLAQIGSESNPLEQCVLEGDLDRAKHLQEHGFRLDPDIADIVRKKFPDRVPGINLLLEAQRNQAKLNKAAQESAEMTAPLDNISSAKSANNGRQMAANFPRIEVAGDAYPRHPEELAQHGYNELFADTGAHEADSNPFFELDGNSHPARPVGAIEPDGFNLSEFQEQAKQSVEDSSKSEKKKWFSLFTK